MTRLTPLQHAIIAALQEGDRTQSALLDCTDAKSCPELNAALKSLSEQGLIAVSVRSNPPNLVYKIKGQRKAHT